MRNLAFARLVPRSLFAISPLLWASACATSSHPQPSGLTAEEASPITYAPPDTEIPFTNQLPSPRQQPTRAIGPKDPHAEEVWRFELRPYLWVPKAEGKITLSDDTDAADFAGSGSTGPVKSILNALVLQAEAGVGLLSLFAQFSYLRLERDQSSSSRTLDIEYSQAILELGEAYEVLRQDLGAYGTLLVEPLGGVRVHFLDVEVSDRSSGDRRTGKDTWADLFLGVRFRAGAEDGFGLMGRFDAGAGGSDATWNAIAGVDWRFSSCAALSVGYRCLSIDYASGSGNDRFAYDVLLHGPFVGLSFRF